MQIKAEGAATATNASKAKNRESCCLTFSGCQKEIYSKWMQHSVNILISIRRMRRRVPCHFKIIWLAAAPVTVVVVGSHEVPLLCYYTTVDFSGICILFEYLFSSQLKSSKQACYFGSDVFEGNCRLLLFCVTACRLPNITRLIST